MVRGRRNQLHSGSRVADLGDVVGDLAPGQLPALARLGSLRDLDLDLLGACEIFGGHPETPRGDLLDLGLEHVAFAQFDVARDAVRSEARAQRLARLHRRVALAVLAALAGIRLPADAVHRHREGGVRFDRDRTVRHCAGRKTLYYLGCGLDLLDRNRLHAIDTEFEQTAEGHVAPRLVVDDRGVFLVRLGGVLPRRMLQLRDRVGRPHMLFAAHAPSVLAPRIQHRLQHRIGVLEGGLVYADRFCGDFEHADAFDRRGGAGEIFVHERPREAYRLEDLRAGVGHVGRCPHLGHHLLQALADRPHEILDRLPAVEVRAELALRPTIGQRVQGEIRMYRLAAVASRRGKVVYLAHRARFTDETRA